MGIRANWAAAAVAVGVLLPGVASASVLDGASVNASWMFPSDSSLYKNYGDTTVGAGTEYTSINVDGVILFDVDIADTSITVNFLPSSGTFTSASFNGLYITDLLSMFPSLSVYSVLVSGFTFTSSDVIFGSSGFGLNFQGDSFAGGESVTVNFAAPVPLPAGLPLLALALGGLGVLRSRRKAA